MELKRRPDIDRFLKGPDKAMRGAVIHGRDRQVVRERADTLARAINATPDDPFDTALLTDTELSDGSRLEGELTALSLAGGRRLIRLRLSTDKSASDKLLAETLQGHADGAFNTEAFLIIEAPALTASAALRKIAQKSPALAEIPCYDDEAGDVARMIRESLAAEKIALSGEALELLVARLPHERGVQRQEVERLALFLGPGRTAPASAAELEEFLGVEPEASLFDAAQDAFGGRAAPAQAHLRRAAAEGESGPAVVRAIGMHLGKLRRVLTQAQAGKGLQEAAKSSGVFWKNEKEFLRQARTWTLPMLDALSADVYAADLACKQTGSPDSLIAERLALSIAGKARRLGL